MTVDLDIPTPTPPPKRELPGAARARANREPEPQLALPGVEPSPLAPVLVIGDTAPLEQLDWAQFNTPTQQQGSVEFIAPAERELPATWGRRQAALRVLSFGLAKPKPGQEERAYREDVRGIREAHWPRSVRVAVANPKGGVGKTPTSVILAGILASARGGSVAAVDLSDSAGTLRSRAEGVQERCVSDVEADPGSFQVPGTIATAAATQSSFADIIGSLGDREFDASSVDRVMWALDRTYRISVADTGSNTPHSPAFQEVLALADLLVVPTIVTADSVTKAAHLLSTLQDGGLAAHAVVAVLTYGGPETPGLRAQIPGIFEAVGVGAVQDIPFDREIARGTAINTRRLTRPSTLAWTRLAAAAIQNITLED